MQSIDISRVSPLSPEDVARAQWYSLIARLFASPLDAGEQQQLIKAGGQLKAAEDELSELDEAFLALCVQAASADAKALGEEFESLFVGTGKAEVMLNASFQQAGFLHEKPLVDLRSRLNHLGIVRKSDISETEDHLSLLCSAMQQLILDRRSIAEQRDLFTDFLADWFETASTQLIAHPQASFYGRAASVWKLFFALERQSFDFED
jgi:TorA maturation chaperone TorD